MTYATFDLATEQYECGECNSQYDDLMDAEKCCDYLEEIEED